MKKHNISLTIGLCALTACVIIFTANIHARANNSSNTLFIYCSIFFTLMLIICFAITFAEYRKAASHNNSLKKLYAQILDHTDVGLAMTDRYGSFDFTNGRFRQLMNIDEENLFRYSALELFPEELTARLIKMLSAAEGKDSSGISDTFLLNGRYIYLSLFVIKNENGGQKYITTAQDHTSLVTLDNQLKKEIHKSHALLDANETMYANISHELKTPLNAVIGLSSILEDTSLNKEQHDIVTKIKTSSDLLLGLINEVLDYSKLKHDSITLYPSSFTLQELLKNVRNTFYSISKDKELAWMEDFNFNRELTLYADKLRLIQIFNNLISNAVKFTDKGYIKLSASVLSDNEDLLSLKFAVSDTGIGIDSDKKDLLFHEFKQLENHLTKEHQGTGLGLSICKQLVEKMDGNIWVESIKGSGTTFYFTVKVAKSHSEISSDSSDPVLFDGGGAQILIAEDTDINYDVIEGLLQKCNVICVRAKNGLEAIELCRSHPSDHYKAILMDIHMPKMDGYETSEIIKKQLGLSVPILAVTAGSMDDRHMKKHMDLFDGCILKPFSFQLLCNVLAPYFREDPLGGRDEAIKNLGNDSELYLKHLKKFQSSQCETADEIKKLIDDQNWPDARRAVHSIKGLAGMLGLPFLQSSALELEHALANLYEDSDQTGASCDGDIDCLFLRFSEKLDEVLKANL